MPRHPSTEAASLPESSLSLAEHSEDPRYVHLLAETQRARMERLGPWKGFEATYIFRCGKGHEIRRHLKPFTTQSKMAECQPCKNQQLIQQMRSLARKAGVTLLSKQWLGQKMNHQFHCAHGHTWAQSGRSALSYISCAICTNGRRKQSETQLLPDGLKRLQQAAKRHGGECLSQTYLGVTAKYAFRCAQGHEWQVRGASVMNANRWCPRCRHWPIDRDQWQVDGLTRLQEAAANHKGTCLAEAYTGANAYYRFRCTLGHEWNAKASHILAGTWCKRCMTLSQRLTIEDARAPSP